LAGSFGKFFGAFNLALARLIVPAHQGMAVCPQLRHREPLLRGDLPFYLNEFKTIPKGKLRSTSPIITKTLSCFQSAIMPSINLN